MKMIYHTKHTNNRDNKKKLFVIFLLVLFFIFLFSVVNPLRTFVLNTFSPLFKTGNYFYDVFAKIPKKFADQNQILKENEGLLDEIENLRINLINYESLKYENERLYTNLGLKPAGDFVGAKIIAKSPQIALDTLLINKGTASDLGEGSMVLVGEGILMGKIVRVYKDRSMVALNSFPDKISYGYIERTGEPLEIKGVGGGSIQTRVPINFDIVLQDKIMLEDSQTYLVAIVSAIEENSASGFKNVLLSLPVNVSKLRIVFIGK